MLLPSFLRLFSLSLVFQLGLATKECPAKPPTTTSPERTPTTSVTSAAPTGTGIDTAEGYAIVSPTACPDPVRPTGDPIAESDDAFADANNGLRFQQFVDAQFIFQTDDGSGKFFVDMSDPEQLVVSDEDGDTLVVFANGTFVSYMNDCEVAFVGLWQEDAVLEGDAGAVSRRTTDMTSRHGDLEARQLDTIVEYACKATQFFCSNPLGKLTVAVGANRLCGGIGAAVFARIGARIGLLGNVLGPQVGLPAALIGYVIGKKYGSDLCTVAVTAATFLCDDLECPDPEECGEGTIQCNEDGPCQDGLSDPNNCGACGNVCESGKCNNGQCTQPTCNGDVCGSLGFCEEGNGSCYCFSTAAGTGFCGPSTPCAGLDGCSSDFDCAQGMVCAVGTCCGRNVCHPPCTMLARRDDLDLLDSNVTTGLWSAGVPDPEVLALLDG